MHQSLAGPRVPLVDERRPVKSAAEEETAPSSVRSPVWTGIVIVIWLVACGLFIGFVGGGLSNAGENMVAPGSIARR